MKENIPIEDEDIAVKIFETDVVDEMADSFTPYALSVIISRAIPDARDGLKPVQRRILYGMWQLGLNPTGGFRKSAAVVGEVMGKYHPHGDSAIYDAMVRMGQNHAYLVPFVGPRGNYGGRDDGPAAARYTEARLSKAAIAMLEGINQNAVDFQGTFDGEREEPLVLPAGIPNLLVNGVAGIAVGMTTDIPPHNLEEVVSAALETLKQKGCVPLTEKRISKIIKGPDFPTGGILHDDKSTGGLAEIYKTGSGSLKLRGKTQIETGKKGRDRIVITELPFNIGPEKIVAEINKLIKDEKAPGDSIASVANISDKNNGIKIVVVCKPNATGGRVLGQLWKTTSLEKTIKINAVAIVDSQPKLLSYAEILSIYSKHLVEVILRKSEYIKKKAEDRKHIVDALLKAVDSIDEVIDIIRGSSTYEDSKKTLQKKLKIDEIQAEAILELRIKRLSSLEVQTLQSEKERLQETIAEKTEIIGSEKRQREEATKELKENLKSIGKEPRQTEVVKSWGNISDESSTSNGVETQEIHATILPNRKIKVSDKEPSSKAPYLARSFGDNLIAVTTEGSLYYITDNNNLPSKNRWAGIIGDKAPIMVVSSNFTAARIEAEAFRGMSNIKNPEGEIIAVFEAPDDKNIAMVASDGTIFKCPASVFKPTKGTLRFLPLQSPNEGVRLVSANICEGGDQIGLFYDNKQAKVLEESEITLRKGRGGKGVSVKGGQVQEGFIGNRIIGVEKGKRNSKSIPISRRNHAVKPQLYSYIAAASAEN